LVGRGVVELELLDVVVLLELELDELEVELELEVEVELLLELELEPELEVPVLVVLVAVVEVVGVVALGWQDSLSEATVPTIGRFIEAIGVPGGTLTLKVSV
jgi:hypothetical protein